jgi:DNA-directed RNA polymerase specialized sigma subunit
LLRYDEKSRNLVAVYAVFTCNGPVLSQTRAERAKVIGRKRCRKPLIYRLKVQDDIDEKIQSASMFAVHFTTGLQFGVCPERDPY